jgi:hypothetical protein
MFLAKPRGQSHRELWSEDWWAQSEGEVHRAGEGVVVSVSRTPGPGLVGIFAAEASPSDAASPSGGGGEGAEGSGKGGCSGTKGGGVSSGSPTNMGFSGFFTFFPVLGSSCHPGYHNPTCFL